MPVKFADLHKLYGENGWTSPLDVAKCLFDYGLCPLPLDPAVDGRLKAAKTRGWPSAPKSEMMDAITRRINQLSKPTGIGCRVQSDIWWLDFDAPGKDWRNTPALMNALRAKTALGLTDDDLAAMRASFHLKGKGGFVMPIKAHRLLKPLFESRKAGFPGPCKAVVEVEGGGQLELYGTLEPAAGAQVAIASDRFTKRPIGGTELFQLSESLAGRMYEMYISEAAQKASTTSKHHVQAEVETLKAKLARAPQQQHAAAILSRSDATLDWAGFDYLIDKRLKGQLAGTCKRISGFTSARHHQTLNAALAQFGYLKQYNRPDLLPLFYESLVSAYETCCPERSGAESNRLITWCAEAAESLPGLEFPDNNKPRKLMILTGSRYTRPV